MILNVTINEQSYPMEISPRMIEEGESFFTMMDRDMDAGWQMSREWVPDPSSEQRCQIAADRMLTAIESDNQKLAALMAAYIMKRMPEISHVDIDTSGDMTLTELKTGA